MRDLPITGLLQAGVVLGTAAILADLSGLLAAAGAAGLAGWGAISLNA